MIRKQMYLSVCLSLFFVATSQAQTTSSFTDPRDEETYKTVAYEIQEEQGGMRKVEWLAENLRFEISDSFCLYDQIENCSKGRFYTWSAAMEACPEGWRLPSDSDWYDLVNLYGGLEKAGRHLKSKQKLWPEGGGTNKSGFSGLALGVKDGDVQVQYGYSAFFWSSTENENDPKEAYDWSFVTNKTEVRHWSGYKPILNCVRCVRD